MDGTLQQIRGSIPFNSLTGFELLDHSSPVNRLIENLQALTALQPGDSGDVNELIHYVNDQLERIRANVVNDEGQRGAEQDANGEWPASETEAFDPPKLIPKPDEISMKASDLFSKDSARSGLDLPVLELNIACAEVNGSLNQANSGKRMSSIHNFPEEDDLFMQFSQEYCPTSRVMFSLPELPEEHPPRPNLEKSDTVPEPSGARLSFNLDLEDECNHSFFDNPEEESPYSAIFNATSARPVPPNVIELAANHMFLPWDAFQGKYEIGEKLGKGACGIVKKAVNVQTTEEFAVKILRKDDFAFDKSAIAKEIYILRMLVEREKTQVALELVEVSENEGEVFLVMELLRGGPLLEDLIHGESYSHRKACDIITNLLTCIDTIHDLNIVHRDVKPENFIFKDSGTWNSLKITDFGISHYSEDSEQLCKTMIGTPLYVAPEVLFQQKYSKEADIWSIGVLSHILISGFPPFDDPDVHKLVRKVKYSPVQFEGTEWLVVPSEAKDFLALLLDKDPMNRPTAKEALNHPWIKNRSAVSDDFITITHKNIARFHLRTKWRVAINAALAAKRLQGMIPASPDVPSEGGQETTETNGEQAEPRAEASEATSEELERDNSSDGKFVKFAQGEEGQNGKDVPPMSSALAVRFNLPRLRMRKSSSNCLNLPPDDEGLDLSNSQTHDSPKSAPGRIYADEEENSLPNLVRSKKGRYWLPMLSPVGGNGPSKVLSANQRSRKPSRVDSKSRWIPKVLRGIFAYDDEKSDQNMPDEQSVGSGSGSGSNHLSTNL